MKISDEVRARLQNIRALMLDVDGVLTSGDIIYSDSGAEAKEFDVKDGLGIRVAVEFGLRVALISGRASSVVHRRMRDMRVTDLLERIGDKASAMRTWSAENGIPVEQIAHMGDDLNDRGAMRIAGLAIAPADAAPDILALAHLVTDAPGGRGAAREAVEAILRAQGTWDEAVDRYLQGLAERDHARRTES